MSRMYCGPLSTTSDACSTKTEPAAARKPMPSTSTVPRIRPVAGPRRHPRWASRSTPGSIARARKKATSTMISSVWSLRSAQYANSRPTTQAATTATVRGYHGGSARGSRDCSSGERSGGSLTASPGVSPTVVRHVAYPGATPGSPQPASAMTCNTASWTWGGPATTSPDVSHARASPLQSVTRPPASRTSSAPAATSHGPSACSK